MVEARDHKSIFGEIYEREADAIFRFCFLRVHDRERAIDITEEVFLELWKAYHTDTVIEHERAYLFTLARNRIIDWYRRKKSESLDALIESEDTPFDFADPHAHRDIMLSAEAKEVVAEIEKLEPSYRDVLYLRFVEDLTPQEIASIVGGTANNISVRITRGLEKIREQLHLKS